MSNDYTPGPSSGTSGNGSSFASRRDMRASNVTGALPTITSTQGVEGLRTSSSDFEYLIQSLHELFEHDRQVASQQDSTRCGICYLYFMVDELYYCEVGYYVCPACEQSLSRQHITMLRKQQKM